MLKTAEGGWHHLAVGTTIPGTLPVAVVVAILIRFNWGYNTKVQVQILYSQPKETKVHCELVHRLFASPGDMQAEALTLLITVIISHSSSSFTITVRQRRINCCGRMRRPTKALLLSTI